MASLQSDLEISRDDLLDAGIKVSSLQSALTDILSRESGIKPEMRATARLIAEAVDSPAWYKTTGFNDRGDIVLEHRMPGRLLKKISNQSNVAFISATLSIGEQFKDFQMAMGITQISPLSGIIEPEKHGVLEFNSAELEVGTPEWLAGVIEAARKAPKPLLVATGSHDLARTLGDLLPGSVVRERGESMTEALLRVGEGEIFLSADAWAGLDTKKRWRSVIVPAVPFEPPSIIDNQVLTSFFASRNTAIRRLRQVIGRGLRTPDAVFSVHILDRRINKLGGFVPKRFQKKWAERDTGEFSATEGGRKYVELSIAERCPSIRKAALKHYGKQCMGNCGAVIRAESQLDVHHRDPIAEGVRKTLIHDLAVLCANCHRLVHSTNPPISIEALQAINTMNLETT